MDGFLEGRKTQQRCTIWLNVTEVTEGLWKCWKILESTAQMCLQVCPAQECVTRPVKPELGGVSHKRGAGVGAVGWGYADPTGCQQTAGKWLPEKAITMIN